MKTKFALMTALLAFSYAFSQEINPKLKVYSQKVDSIVFSEKSKMNKELDDLERSYLDNKITADEKREKKTEIAERYEEIINGKVTAEKDQLETATREMVKDAVMGDPKKQSLQLLAQNNAVLVLNTGIKKTKKSF
uniref:OmpH family outer membrane protein n=1 Tax=Chryseobacterium endophyticum TaxID=1854762 RepID=A0AAU6WKQ9_9FLAO